jgi:hypothetical protein
MPIRVTSFYLPASPSLPYILEDVYVRGGFRSVATETDRNGISPLSRKIGMLVYCVDVDKYFRLGSDKLTWYEMNLGVSGGGGSSGGGVRSTFEITAASSIKSGDSLNLSLALDSPSVMVLKLTLDSPDIKFEVFSNSDMSDQNPFTFISNTAQMTDEGLSVLNGTTERTRRFSFWATQDGTKTHLARITNVGVVEVTPSISIKYLTLEG